MKVYVLIGSYQFEDNYILGVYSTLELAELHKGYHKDKDKWTFLQISEHEIITT